MDIYKFVNNTYPWRIRRRSNLGHIFREKRCVLWAGKYGKSLHNHAPGFCISNIRVFNFRLYTPKNTL